MRDHDVFLLTIGINLGTVLMLLVQLVGDAVDDRRWRRALARSRDAAGIPGAAKGGPR